MNDNRGGSVWGGGYENMTIYCDILWGCIQYVEHCNKMLELKMFCSIMYLL